MKFGVVVFPGSNCNADAYNAIKNNVKSEVKYLWHKDTNIEDDIDCVILPGGFSYGDYLRCGAIARFSPIMNEVIKFANKGKYVIGICNGFQILTESGLLPGTLLRNNNLSFICDDIYLKPINNNSVFTSAIGKDDVLKIPIAHGEGNYFVDDKVLSDLYTNEQIAFKYCNSYGDISIESNPNGSLDNIAGIFNKNKNVLGMMPHPERYSDIILGSEDGLKVFNSLTSNFN